MKNEPVINFAIELLKKQSITPNDDGVMKLLSDFLENIGFTNEIVEFSSTKPDGDSEKVLNLYSSKKFGVISQNKETNTQNSNTQKDAAKINENKNQFTQNIFEKHFNETEATLSLVNKQGEVKFLQKDAAKIDLTKHLSFAGHVDVVHPGKEYKWTYKPFEPTIENGVLYARGVSDMKAAIACFAVAVKELVDENVKINGEISFLITGDEEGSGENGTKKLLQHITNKQIKIDDCIVGEPTNPDVMGTMVKIGRRGSANFTLTIEGEQGHIAYPSQFLNPIEAISSVVILLKNHIFDKGNEFFDPTNLEFFKIEADNIASNVVSHSASVSFNIRFNNLHTYDKIKSKLEEIISSEIDKLNKSITKNNIKYKYNIKSSLSGESFVTNANIHLVDSIVLAVENVCKTKPILSTTGGTSDARFIKNYANTVEFGMISKTAHQIDENEKVADIITLKNIYKQFIIHYFNGENERK